MTNFMLNIFTPNGVVIKGLKASSLTIPTVRGELNILPGHTHIVSELETGILSVNTSNGIRRFSMTAGLLKVLGSEITVLSTTSEKAEDIDISRAKAAEAKAQSRLSSKEAVGDLARIKFERKLERAKARIKLANLK